jgi:hypothetical protein
VFFEKKFCSSAAATDEFWETEVSIPAPCRDGEVPPEPSPSVSIAVSAVSIDLVRTPDYLSGIPDMHTIHDPIISMS